MSIEKKASKDSLNKLNRIDVSSNGRQVFLKMLETSEQYKPFWIRLRPLLDFRFNYVGIKDTYKYFLYNPIPAFTRVGVLAAVFICIYMVSFSPQIPVLTNINGVVKIFDSSKNAWIFAKNDMKLHKNDILKTFTNGTANLSCGDVYAMRISNDSELTVTALSNRATLRPIKLMLEKGKTLAFYNGAIKEHNREFTIQTQQLQATALGTDFMVQSLPASARSRVGVLEGVVKVTSLSQEKSRKDQSVYVKSKELTEVSEGNLPRRPRRMIESEINEITELYSLGKETQVALLISAGPDRTRELLSLAPIYISESDSGTLAADLKKAASLIKKAVKSDALEDHIKVIVQFEKIIEANTEKHYNPQFILFTAAYYSHIGKYAESIASFDKLLSEYPDSHLASIALCAKGIIFEEKLGNTKSAIKAYKTIIKNYPKSPEFTEAISGLKRLAE